MAPVDPDSILEALSSVISEKGGILNVKDVPYMAQLMEKFSEKLVSRCVYSNILLATEETILEEFLKQGGWMSIYMWLNDALNKKDEPFLFLILQVLDKCPVTIERLKINDTAKILTKMAKNVKLNQDLRDLATKVRAKWKAIVTPDGNLKETKSNNEKRKLKDTSNNNRNENSDTSPFKKAKTIDENVNLNSQKIKSTETINNLTNNKLNDTKTNSKPVKTAKCKLSKPRSIGVLEKAENSAIKPASTNHSANQHHNHNTNVGGSFMPKNLMLLNPTASTPSLPLNKLNKLEDKGIKIIEPQPLPVNELINQTSVHTAKHLYKESASFMDALNSASKIKKKKKKDEKTEKLNSKKNSTTKEENVDESMEIDDLNTTSNSATDDSNNKINDNSIHSPTPAVVTPTNNDSEYLEFSNVKPFDPFKTPTKSILCFVAKKHNKRIFWADDDKLEKVKLFEIDEGERCNVFKQNNFKEHRKEEMSKERENVMKVKIPNAGITYVKNWELKRIDLDGVEVYETGVNSKEKEIQSKRLEGVLEDLDIGLKPEFPKEPDTTSNQPVEEPKNIPLVDENNIITDHSNEKYTISDNQLNSYSSLNQSDVNLTNGLLSSSYVNQQFSQLPNYNLYNTDQNNLYQPQQMYNSYPSMYQSQHLQPSHPITTDQKWINSNWDSTNQHNNHNYNHNNTNYNKKKFNNKKDTFTGKLRICKFYQKNGKCKFGDDCAFKHTK